MKNLNEVEVVNLEDLFKYELIYFSSCRWIDEIYDYKDMMCDRGGIDVVDFVVEERMEKEENWVKYVGSFLNDEDWKKKDNWRDELIEGDMNSNLFMVGMCDELSEVMVIRSDSEYYGKFNREVEDVRDEKNIELYYRIWEKMI
jgi:hypothetical protein